YYNFRADPHVELQDGPRKQDMIAREVSGDERAQWWERAVAAYPPYAEYQQLTTRQIPVFVLEPAAGRSLARLPAGPAPGPARPPPGGRGCTSGAPTGASLSHPCPFGEPESA